MIFDLTDSLANAILFSMEDQDCSWMVDAEHGTVVPKDAQQRTAAEYGAVPANAKIDDDKFYALPEWTSGDGYALLESFTNTLYSPLARAEL